MVPQTCESVWTFFLKMTSVLIRSVVVQARCRHSKARRFVAKANTEVRASVGFFVHVPNR